MTNGGVYTPPTFMARGINHSTMGIGARNEYCKHVHPSNIHREGIDPSEGGIGAQDEYWMAVQPSNIYREGYRPLVRGHRDAQ